MAKLTADPQPVQAPDMFGYSKTPSRFEVSENNYLGKLFGNLGEDVDAGAKGSYQAIDANLKSDARTALNPILDNGTSDLGQDDVRAIAGTGARGSKYQSAAVDTTTDAFGNPTDNALPAGAQQRLDGAKRMYQSYLQGNMSDSMVDMKISAVAKNLKEQYPGFEEEVDKSISEMRGTSSANKLRESVLRDFNAMSASSQSAQNKLMTEYDKDAPYLPAGTSFTDYAKDPIRMKTMAQTWRAGDEDVKQQKANLELAASKGSARGDYAERAYTAEANQYVSKSFHDAIESAQFNLVQLSGDAANANPKEVEDNKQRLGALRTQAELNLQQMLNRPIGDDPSVTYASIIKDPAKLDAIKKQALAPFDAVISRYGNPGENHIAAAAANIGKNMTSQDYLRFTQTFPAARALKSIEQGSGPQAAAVALSNNPALMEPLSKAVADTAWYNIKYQGDGTPPPSAGDAAAAVSAATTKNPGAAARAMVQSIQEGAVNKDPETAGRFVQSLYGDDKLFPMLKTSEQRKDFQMLASPAFTAKMVELKKSNPEAFDTYAGRVEKWAPIVMRQEAADLQSATTYNRYDVTFDPKTLQYTAATKAEFAPTNVSGHAVPDNANAYVAGINRLGATLRPVLEAKYGDQAPQAYMNILRQAGFDPNAAKSDGWAADIGDAIKKGVGAVGDYLNTGGTEPNRALRPGESPTGTGPGKRSDATTGKLSLEDSQIPADGTGRWAYAYDKLTSKYGYKPEIASGILGSLAGETATLNPTQIHDGGIGLGIAGWNKDRLTALKSYAAGKNLNFKDADVQLDFVNHELHTTEKATLAALDRARTPDEAAAIFTHLYERPSQPNTRARMGNALGFYRAFNKQAG